MSQLTDTQSAAIVNSLQEHISSDSLENMIKALQALYHDYATLLVSDTDNLRADNPTQLHHLNGIICCLRAGIEPIEIIKAA